eukprot:SAG22_NODE_648_length_8185_cov_242.957828_6_plen_63_part_00
MISVRIHFDFGSLKINLMSILDTIYDTDEGDYDILGDVGDIVEYIESIKRSKNKELEDTTVC